MRFLLLAALVLAVIAVILVILGRTFLDGGPDDWFIASWMTFLLDLAVGAHLPTVGSPRA